MTITAMRLLGMFLLAGTLAACGSEANRNPLLLISKTALQTFKPGGRDAPVDARDVLTPELLAASDTSVLLVVQLDRDQGFSLVPDAANLGTVQWRGGGGIGVLRRDGIVVGTRGLGHDLHTADVAALNAAFDAGGAEDAVRINRFLTSEGVIETQQMICSVSLLGRETLNIYGKAKNTRVFAEDCRAGGGDFVNRYWVEADGTVRKSRERISPELGTFEITRLTE